jgi:primosomal protein N' (replication factor Y) (superfamily II helicase)
MRYPPFSALANILVRDEIQEEALRKSTELERMLRPEPKEMRVMGPAPAPVPRLKNEFRYQLLLKSSDRKQLNETLHTIRRFAAGQKWGATSLVIDVDPVSLL